MPRIIVQADITEPPSAGATTTLQERVVPSQLESPHYSAQLIERLVWAVGDAAQVEDSPPPTPTVPPTRSASPPRQARSGRRSPTRGRRTAAGAR